MKQIIVLTDFTPAAENAMLYAGALARKVGARLMLLHVFQLPVAMSDVPVMMVPADDLKQNADNALANTRELLLKSYPQLDVVTESRMGDVSDELNDLCKDSPPFAIVIGRHAASGVERFFFGSTSLSVVRHTAVPVLVVPENSTKKGFNSMALAIDDLTGELPQERIRGVVESLGSTLHVIHVQSEKSETKDFNQLVAGLNTSCKTIHDDEFLNGIRTYLEENDIDILMVLPHHHSFVERLTFRTHTEELLRKLTIPVLCINSEVR